MTATSPAANRGTDSTFRGQFKSPPAPKELHARYRVTAGGYRYIKAVFSTPAASPREPALKRPARFATVPLAKRSPQVEAHLKALGRRQRRSRPANCAHSAVYRPGFRDFNKLYVTTLARWESTRKAML
jgi:hypothetical protein